MYEWGWGGGGERGGGRGRVEVDGGEERESGMERKTEKVRILK